MNNPYKIEERQARHIFAGLVDCGLIVDCSFYRWYNTFCDPESEYFKLLNETGKLKRKITWSGSLGELGYLASELYGVYRWERLKCFYKLPSGRLSIRAVQSTLSRIGYKNLPDKYPNIKAILESKPPTIEELLERYRR